VPKNTQDKEEDAQCRLHRMSPNAEKFFRQIPENSVCFCTPMRQIFPFKDRTGSFVEAHGFGDIR
jgi:hypothetical protein